MPIIHEQYGSPSRCYSILRRRMSLTALANELIRQSIPNQKGKASMEPAVSEISSPTRGLSGDKKFPALVTQELFVQVQSRLEETVRMKRESQTRELCQKGGITCQGWNESWRSSRPPGTRHESVRNQEAGSGILPRQHGAGTAAVQLRHTDSIIPGTSCRIPTGYSPVFADDGRSATNTRRMT